MSVDYFLVFGSGSPASKSGLSPTFTVFSTPAGGSTTAPAISEVSTTGIYTFNYAPQGPIAFVVDGATTGLATADRYIVGALDLGDESGTVAIGTSADSIGDNLADPSTLFGFIRRIKELLEGDSTYTKSSGVYVMKDTSGATTIASKTITDSGLVVTKT
jgi:hypothetical protein